MSAAEKAEILLRNPNLPFRDPDPEFTGQALTHTELAYILYFRCDRADIAMVLAHCYPKDCKNCTGDDVDAIFDKCREIEAFGRWDGRREDEKIEGVLKVFQQKLGEIEEKKVEKGN